MTSSATEAGAWSRRDTALAVAAYGTFLGLLLISHDRLGVVRDEGFYHHAARHYGAWLQLLVTDSARALTFDAIDRYWSVNHEHPSLVKGLSALSLLLLEKSLGPLLAHRFPAMALSAIVAPVLYGWGRLSHSRLAGLAAAVLFLGAPRAFFHAHLACFDGPVTALWCATAFAYLRLRAHRGWRGPIVVAVLYGLLLQTKHNAWLLPFALALHLVLEGLWYFLLVAGPSQPRPGAVRRWLAAPLRVAAAGAVLSPLVFVALWPWLWRAPLGRFLEYVAFHRGHEYYNMAFLGVTYHTPPMPRLYAWVMTVATVPTITLVLAAVGVGVALSRGLPARVGPSMADARRPAAEVPTDALLWLAGAVTCYAPWWSTTTPIFGGVKHFLPALPFLCLFAGVAAARCCHVTADLVGAGPRRAPAVAAAVVLALTGAPVVQALRAPEWGLNAYTPAVGGAPGAATLGLNRGYWGGTSRSIYPVIAEALPAGSRLYLHDTARSSYRLERRDGAAPRGVASTLDLARSDGALYHHEAHMSRVEHQIWVVYGTRRPAIVGVHDGVPIVWFYRRD